MAAPTSLRLRPAVRAAIERIAKRTRRSFSDVAQSLLEEGLRMRVCPGIYFADEPAGRVAKVAGTGLGVWEVMRDYNAVEGDEPRLREILPQIGASHLAAARRYYSLHREEIEDLIADNEAAAARLAADR